MAQSSDLIGLLAFVVSMGFTVVVTLFSLVLTALMMVVPLGLVFLVMKSAADAQAAHQRLLKTGRRAPAKVESVRETGMYINHQPQVEIVLLVAPPGEDEFRVKHTRVVSMLQIPRIQPNGVVEVAYDPERPSTVAIVGL